MTGIEERRRFFRIDDSLGVAWRLLSEEELQSNASQDQRPMDVYSLLGSLENKIEHCLGQYRIKDPAAAELFDLLNQKINCVVNQMEAESIIVQKMAHRLQEVNISACGLGFHVDSELGPGDKLLLDFVLHPSSVHITCYGTVIACEATTEADTFYTRVDFSNITEADQEMLIQHLVKRQGTLMRSVKNANFS